MKSSGQRAIISNTFVNGFTGIKNSEMMRKNNTATDLNKVIDQVDK